MCSGSTENTLAVIYRGKVLFLVSSGSQNPHLKAALIRAMRQTMQKL
jgi:ribosomal protein L16/L10AE